MIEQRKRLIKEQETLQRTPKKRNKKKEEVKEEK